MGEVVRKSRKKPITKTTIDLLVKHQEAFELLVDTAWRAYKRQPLPKTYPRYCLVFYCEIIPPIDESLVLEREDVVQQLKLIWHECLLQYKKTRPGIKLYRYLLRIGRWKLRDWVNLQASVVENQPAIQPNDSEDESSFRLSLNYLVNGSDEQPWSTLTPYERQIIYLRFVGDKSIPEIARLLQRDVDTINLHLTRILTRLKEP